MLIRITVAGLLLWGLSALPAAAQTEFVSQKRAARKSLKAARKYQAPEDLRQSHLAVDKRDLRPGETPERNLPEGSNRYRFDNTGTPRVSDQKMITTRKPKKQPKESE
ncbi:hypothetical protein [Hymenobacter jeollabukensis]|uniref:Uncharacterized protein n=1 Tax=Hymenobacter jeollabukensis TaxID=2025313 RepID=A0A5R8WSZ4_9BACT|nr:hypothetical protein [Hymenobacter jeollabukensis]TLM94046.1 hypothetical protein FDY95_08445 [Hymenobacter jeollabukensis]